MSRYNLIQIGSTYLTRDGSSGGSPCKTSVSGLSNLKPARNKNIVIAIDGTSYGQSNAGKKGIFIEIGIDWLAKTVFDTINTAFDALDSADTTIAVVISGDTGNFSFNAKTNSDYVTFEKFSGGVLQGIKYRLVTA